MRGFGAAAQKGGDPAKGCTGDMTIIIPCREAFFPPESPYLGQALPGEPVGKSNVLSPNRRSP
jgi:hypothetical protein